MKAEVKFESPAALFAFADANTASEVRLKTKGDVEPLRDQAKTGATFFLEGGDPWGGHFHIYVDEPVPREIEETCSARSGSFLLRVPSGRLGVVGLGTVSSKTEASPETRTLDVPPGDYLVSLLDGSIKDARAITAQQEALVDPADWRLFERVNHFGAIGCGTLAIGMLFVLIPYTRREYWFLLPMFMLPTCAHSFLRHLPGYKRVSERCREHADSLPQYIISLKRVETTEGLEGGWYQCQ